MHLCNSIIDKNKSENLVPSVHVIHKKFILTTSTVQNIFSIFLVLFLEGCMTRTRRMPEMS